MTDDETYHLEYHRAMEAAYKRQLGVEYIKVYEADYQRFNRLCDRWGQTPQQMFHSLLLNAPEFNPALPKQGKWSVGDNRFDEDGKNPKSLSIFIPEDSIDGFCRYVQNMRSKLKAGKVYNYQTQSNEDAQGVYLNFKGKQGNDGAFGNINPANNDQSMPF